jgi:hypothetical protein
MVRKMGYLNPQTLRRYLLSRITPMLEKYQAAIMLSVYALIEDATAACAGNARGRSEVSATGVQDARAPRAEPRAM